MGEAKAPGSLTSPSFLCFPLNLGQMVSCTRSSGTSFCLSPCIRVSFLAREGTGGESLWPRAGLTCAPVGHPGFVQFLQYYYQSGCLYRLRALGERHTMDLTVGRSCSAAPRPLGKGGFLSEGFLSLPVCSPPSFFLPLPNRGLPVLDVERPHLPASFPLLWTCKSQLGVPVHPLVVHLWI